MTISLQERKDAALEKLMHFNSARRGQLSEQYYRRKKKDGSYVEQGPYYVWQRWLGGKKHSIRVPADQVEQVRADLERGRELQAVFDELFVLMEQMALEQNPKAKKKKKPSPKPKRAKPKPRSR